MASTALLAGTAAGSPGVLGTPSARVASHSAIVDVATPTIKPFAVLHNANYATGGVALRNRSQGVIHISGVTGKVQRAYLYFTYLFSATPPKAIPITVTRLFPSPSATAHATVSAKLVGTSTDPCWGSSGGAVYRATVPTGLAKANGEYQIQPDASVVGLNTGEDPWDSNVVFPLDEGATLVLIGTGSQTVDLFGGKLAGHEFGGTSFSYNLALSSAPSGTVLMDSFGADGQTGGGRTSGDTDDTVTVNGTQISGVGSSGDTDSDWDGSSGFPLPQLWDDVGHDITSAAAGAGTLAVTISAPNDCLITVGNVVAH
ncbi:MAG TPA: hypothetical protein VIJ62_09260 [Rhizomicrobium sp.]